MNTETQPALRTVKVSTGFFYRTNARGQMGLNWVANFTLPVGIRNCIHAINLGRHFVEHLPFESVVEATIWQEHKGSPREFKGIFSIPSEKLRWWTTTNGYYTARSGNYWLAVPTILWKVVKTPEPKEDTKQKSLF